MMEPSFEKLLVLLADANVDFVLVGGLAVTLQGYVRFTEDVDILIDSDPANVARLLESLADYGEGFSRQLSLEDFAEEEGAIRIIEAAEQCQIDVFTILSGRTFEEVIKDADSIVLKERPIRYASKASLIGWKEASAREKDRLDALALKQLLEDPKAFD